MQPDEQRGLLKLAGGLMVAGFLVFAVVTTLFHPSHHENDHPVIFTKYADSVAWVAIHFGQFAGVLVALGGFIVLHRVLEGRGKDVMLTRFAFAATLATAAVWAVLQAVDGTALKRATEAWAGASGAEKTMRFGDAEAVRWAEWGLQSYFRLLLGLTFVLFATAALRSHIVSRWVAGALILAGLLYASIGVAVGHTGFDKPGGPLVQLLMLTFLIGVLAAGVRRQGGVTPAHA